MQSAKEKLQTLYQIYEKPMYHIAYAILHHPQQAEDAVSEAFCRVIRHLDKIGEPEHPKTKQYMIKIIRSSESYRVISPLPPCMVIFLSVPATETVKVLSVSPLSMVMVLPLRVAVSVSTGFALVS